jgi:hypothetical protein
MRTDSVAAERGRKFATKFLIPAIEILAAIGGSFIDWTGYVSRYRLNGALGVGVSPASNLTTNLPQSTVTKFDKIFVANLKGMTPWVRATSRRMIEENAGNKLMLFEYVNLAAPPLTQAPEGTIQTGLTVQVLNNSSTLGQFGDYANVSDYALGTAIDDTLEGLGSQMSYRMAQVVNSLVQNTADTASTFDPLTNALSKVDDTTFVTTTDITAAAQSLAGVNVLPMEDGRYYGILHPHTVGDILSDKTNNSLVDVVKRSSDGLEQLRELPSPDGDKVPVVEWGGVTFFQSTFVHKTPNFAGGTGTALRTYIIGRDGIIGVSFGGKNHTQIGDGDYRNLQVWIRRLTEPTGYDPSRMIGGFASYNFLYTVTLPPGTNAAGANAVSRIRYIDACSAIA